MVEVVLVVLFPTGARLMFYLPHCSCPEVVILERVGSLNRATSGISLGTFSVKVEKKVKRPQAPSPSCPRARSFWWLRSTSYFSKTLETLPSEEVLRGSTIGFLFSHMMAGQKPGTLLSITLCCSSWAVGKSFPWEFLIIQILKGTIMGELQPFSIDHVWVCWGIAFIVMSKAIFKKQMTNRHMNSSWSI